MIRDDVIYLFDLNDVPLFAFSENVIWETEDLSNSTNRLILNVPIAESSGIKTDQDVYFRGRKYTIAELEKSKNESEMLVICDETQVRLSAVNNPTFTLKDNSLAAAAAKALAKTDWTVGFVSEDERTYNAEIKNESAMFCLRFLENQSGTQLTFDSVKKEVNFTKEQEVIFDGVFRYGNNISNITKSEIQPQATVLYAFGKDGMTIEGFTDGKKYIENFDWYVSLGMTLNEARAKYKKETVWTDDRYIYAGNLYRDAVSKLALMSQPQINYKLDNPEPGIQNLKIGTFVYVADEEFGIKIKTKVSRVKRSKDSEADEIELNYIPPSIGSSDSEFTGDSSSSGSETSFFVTKNQSDVTIGSSSTNALITSITVFSPTAFEMGIAAVLEVTSGGLLEGEIVIDGTILPTKIKQTVVTGWQTIGLPFIATGIQAGTKTLYLNFKMTNGSAKITKEQCELFIKAQGVYGGATNERPDQVIVEQIEIDHVQINVNDNSVNLVEFPIQNDTKVTEHFNINHKTLNIVSNINIELNDI